MNEDEALKIAKSKKSTPEQLKPLIGVSDKVDFLLVKHPNASAEMLDDLSDSHFLDEKMCGAVLAHPNVSVEQLLNSGWEYPSAVFRNPSLPSIMQSQKNFLGEFEGEAFEKSFQKEVPDFVVEWLASGKKSREEVFGMNFLKAADVEVSMQRLGGLINIWCQRHPGLLPFPG